jgi:penicillin V acylase-like amidase (Ntn superfamily)
MSRRIRATLGLIALVGVLAPAPPALALEKQERVIAGSPQESLEVRYLLLRGTNVEIGRALAEIAAERYGARPEPSRDPLRTRAKRLYLEKNYPILYDRMRGVAEAFGQDVADDSTVLSEVGFTELRAGCSIVHLPRTTTADGKSVVSRDYDYSTGSLTFGELAPGMLHPTARPYLIEMHPERGYASLAMVAYEMLSGALDGINSEGLTVTMAMDDELFTKYKLEPTFSAQPGLGVLQMMRMLLDTCATVEEAKEALLTTKQYYEYVPVHYLIADRFGNSFVWEYSEAHNKEYIFENPGKPLVLTNYSLNKHMDGDNVPSVETSKATCTRYAFLSEQLAAAPGTITEDFLRTTHARVDAAAPRSAQKRPPVRTFWHALYYPEERRAKYSFYLRDEDVPGEPDKVRIVRSDYIEFKLEPTAQVVESKASPAPTTRESSAGAPAAVVAPAAVEASEQALIEQLKAAGAATKVERGHLTELGFAKGTNPEPFLPLLRKLPKLRALQLAETQVTDGAMAELRELAQLEYVGLIRTGIGDRGLVYLGNMRNLKTLNATGTRITDAGMVQLKGMTRLEALNISDTAITDAGLANIADMAGIMGLNLSGTKITDAGLAHLKQMSRLTKLNVSNTAVTDAGLAQAKSFLPFFVSIQRGTR